MICEKCRVNIPNRAKYCPKCGATVKIAKTPDIQTKKCPSCGAENSLSAKFCKVDGYQFQQVKKKITEKSKDVIHCPKCGTENRSSAKFCKKDGMPLGEKIKRTPSQQKFIEVSPSKAEGMRLPSNTWIWVTIAGIFLVIGCVGSYLYFTRQLIGEHSRGVLPRKDEKIVKPPLDIAKLEENINSELKDRGLSYVYARVDSDLTATLEGTVYHLDDKRLAEKITGSFGEINKVRNYIVVNQFLAPGGPAEPRHEEVPVPPAPPSPASPRIPRR